MISPMPCTLMISQRFTDQRIWGDIPDRIAPLSEIFFFEQREAGPGSPLPLDEIRQILPEGHRAFDVVVGAEDAAGPAAGLALDGLANGLVLFQPTLDGMPEELEPFNFSGLEDRANMYVPLVAAVNEPDAAKWQSVVADVVEQAIGVHLNPQDAALVRDVTASHAGELQRDLQRLAAAYARGEEPAGPAPGEPWIDRIRELRVPVSIVSTQAGFRIAEVLAARAPHGEAVLARGEGGIPWLEDRDKTVAVLAAMIERGS